MTLAWSAVVGDHTDKLVLLALADNANDAGECYPSLTNIAQFWQIHRATVVRSIHALESAGHVSRRIRPGKNTSYLVHPSHAATSSTEQLVAESDQSHAATNPSHAATPSSPPITPSPSSIRHKPSKSARKALREEPPPSNLCVEAWHRWEQYRKEIRKPIKPASLAAAQRKLAGFGPDQGAVVEQSIAEGWQGLFPLKPQSNGRAQPEPRRSREFPS